MVDLLIAILFIAVVVGFAIMALEGLASQLTTMSEEEAKTLPNWKYLLSFWWVERTEPVSGLVSHLVLGEKVTVSWLLATVRS